jgi:hypothetical protein
MIFSIACVQEIGGQKFRFEQEAYTQARTSFVNHVLSIDT